MIRTKDSSKFDDLRFRPFLVIEAYVKPAPQTRTERKGWKTDKANQQVSEVPTIIDRISSRHLRRAEVIIDIVNDSMIKNRLKGDNIIDRVAFSSELLAFYKDKYADIMQRAKIAWDAQQTVKIQLTMKDAKHDLQP
jgi:hypothetical protein